MQRRTSAERAVEGVACVWLAAGSGSRMDTPVNKAFLLLAGRAMVTRAIEATLDLPDVAERILVVAPHDMAAARERLSRDLPFAVRCVEGGSSRHESEWNALCVLAPDIEAGRIDLVVIHDVARPLADGQLFSDVIQIAREHGGALPVQPAPALVFVEEAAVAAAEYELVAVQTPQAFRARPLLDAYRKAAKVGFVGTDTASCVERFSDLPVRCVPGRDANIKITYADDLASAQRLLAG
ncbi:MAG: 2-C-methyl-D-erythritol 4-phosphate cytidylyltransferase [Nocardioidaceae bacterium]|nr:2-C-methyl-D-erythritol 4-phosphate cytidylyltransferase [Nocardioidaceae bacterium]